jgi:hypothetical protein
MAVKREPMISQMIARIIGVLVNPPAFQQENALSRLRQHTSYYAAARAGADDNHIVF